MVLGVFLLHSPAVMTAASHVSDAMNSMELDMEMMRVDDDNNKVRGPPHNAPAALTARHLPPSLAIWCAAMTVRRQTSLVELPGSQEP